MPADYVRFREEKTGRLSRASSLGLRETLLSPNEDLCPSPVFLIEDEARTAALDVLERETNAVAVEVDAVVAEEGEFLVCRGEAQQPERNGDIDEFLVVLVVGEHAQRRQRRNAGSR